jgi:hypothetical protein
MSVLVWANGARQLALLTTPGLTVVYRAVTGDHVFDLCTIEPSLRFVYRQRVCPQS